MLSLYSRSITSLSLSLSLRDARTDSLGLDAVVSCVACIAYFVVLSPPIVICLLPFDVYIYIYTHFHLALSLFFSNITPITGRSAAGHLAATKLPCLPKTAKALCDARPLLKADSEVRVVDYAAVDRLVCAAVAVTLQQVRAPVVPATLLFSVLDVENILHPRLARRFTAAFEEQLVDIARTQITELLAADREKYDAETRERAADRLPRLPPYRAPSLRDLGPRLMFHGVAGHEARSVVGSGLLAAGERMANGSILRMASGYVGRYGKLSWRRPLLRLE